MPLNPALTRSLTRELNISKIRAGAGGGANSQSLIMDLVNGATTPVISNGGRTLTTSGANFSWGTISDNTFDKDYTEGGKFMIEVTMDDWNSGAFMCAAGLWDPDQLVSSSYGGNHDGVGLLQTTSLMRIYNGPLDMDFESGTVIAAADDQVITAAFNLDDDEVTYYVDGVTTGTFAMGRSTPDSNFLRPVFKAYNVIVMTINPVILYPVDGYVPWG